MNSAMTRILGAVCTAALVEACDKGPPVAPGIDEVLLAVTAAGGLSSSFGLAATAASPTLIDLAWQDNSTNESGFEIHRSTTGPTGAFALMGLAAANRTKDVDASVPPGAEYCYTVRAFRNTGSKTSYTVFSNTACATTPNPAVAPANLEARPASSSAVAITWTDNGSNEDGFRVEQSPSNGGPWDLAITLPPNVTSYEESRASEQQICYRVVAVTGDGPSPPSNIDCTTPPLGPTNLIATASDKTIDLTWVDNSNTEEAYRVERSYDGVRFTGVAWLSANSTSFQDSDAPSNTTHWYRVHAWKDGGVSDFSNTASATRTCVPTGPGGEICDDGVDNDCDDLIDSDDQDCGDPPAGCGEGCGPGYVCLNEVCMNHCVDGFWDGDEGDLDCGGACSVKCQTGQHCWSHWDCASYNCVNDVCQGAAGQP
jgi:hypothetical protein